ncbi:MAG: DNA (cytosine-5-)-methyltransferase, partial [Lachnospiraceae bacterium]|nr:DNA (cytosine-5-)-methyltransferase [Lachnospiraceae bacterium]
YITYVNQTLKKPSQYQYMAVDLFAGCGGLSLGFEAAGIETIGYEMVQDYCETYKKNLGTDCFNEIITKDTSYPSAQIVLGGPPCQPFSHRGKKGGKNDSRNGFPAFIEAIRKIQPDIWICENVKGLPDENPEYFNAVMKEFRELGYVVDCQVIKMVEHDVPQKRERLFIVGHHGWFRFPESNSYRVTAGEALGEMASMIPEDAAFLTPSMDAYIAAYEKASHCIRPRDLHLDEPARTLTCRNLAGATSDMQRIRLPDGRRRRISVREAARLQSFPDWYEFCGSEESKFTQIGNAVPPMFAYRLAKKVISYLKGENHMSYNDLPEINSRTFNTKPENIKNLIRQALQIISCLGIPISDMSARAKEKMAMAFLTVADVKRLHKWNEMKDSTMDYAPTTREIIEHYNNEYGDDVSSGSYDDVRRKDLNKLLLAQIVVNSKPETNNSNPKRGYQINKEYAQIIRQYGDKDWFEKVLEFNKEHMTYEEKVACKRNLPRMEVKCLDGTIFHLDQGEHNSLQKKIIEEFLAIYGYEATVLYCGDAREKFGGIYEQEKLTELGFSDLKQGKLPDVIAYSEKKDWIYMIEAYYTSNPITPDRKLELEKMMGSSVKKGVFVTAFLDANAYKSVATELAWETEIWIATDPEHMIHRNGSRFLGPYSDQLI